MNSEKKGKVFPVFMITLLSIVGFILFVIMTGEKILSKDGIEFYFKETNGMFTESQKNQIENYFEDMGIPSSVVDYIDTNEEIKLMIQDLVFDFYDSFRDGKELKLNEQELIEKIRIEVSKFEEKENIQIWNFIEEDTKKIVNDINKSYNNEYASVMKIVFGIFNKRIVTIVMVLFGLLALPLLISRKMWGILYIFIAVVITSGFAYYVVNYIEFSSEYIPIGLINNLKEIANYNIYKFIYVAFILFMLFIMCLVLKPILHRINIRIKAMKM
jgi:hypothetical protein